MRIVRRSHVPSPWYVFYEFVRQICVGFAITFGPSRTLVGGTRKGVSVRRSEGPSEKTISSISTTSRFVN
jgi:hypothetical protein